MNIKRATPAFRIVATGALWVLCLAAPLSAQHSEDSLLELVGVDAGLCIEVSDLKTHVPAIKQSEFFSRLQKLDLYQGWVKSQPHQTLMHAQTTVEKLTGEPFGHTMKNLFGESVVLAVYPSAQHQSAGVLVTRAANAQAINLALDAWNRTKLHQTHTFEHRGQIYHGRTNVSAGDAKNKTIFYVTLDHRLALSDSEPRIRQVIDLYLTADQPDAAAALIYSPKFHQARESLSGDWIASAYFDPRGWDGTLDYKSDGSYRHRALCEIWSRCESIVAGLHMSEGPVLELIMHYDGSNPSPGWKRFVDRSRGPASFLKRIPPNALAAAAGRHDIGGLKNLIPEFLPQRISRQWDNYLATARGMLFGLDLFDDVLPNLEANWGGYIVAGTPERLAQGAPIDGLVAFQLPDRDHDEVKGRSLRAAIGNALDSTLNLFVLLDGDKSVDEPPVIRSQQSQGVTIHWVDNLGAYRPAYALTEEYVLIASTPECIGECLATKPEKSLAREPRFRHSQRRYCPSDNQLLFVDVEGMRKLLSEHRELFIKQAVNTHGMQAGLARLELHKIEDVLQLVDTAFMAGQINDHRLRLVMGGVALEQDAEAAPGSDE